MRAQAPQSVGLRRWSWLTCLLPVTWMGPAGVVMSAAAATRFSPGDPWASFGLFLLAYLVVALVVMVAISVAAAYLAVSGRTTAALFLLAGIAVMVLYPSNWTSMFEPANTLALLAPGGAAALLALIGLLLQVRRSHWAISVGVVALLLIPVGGYGLVRQNAAGYYSQTCPPGPSIDLTFSGLESGHYTQSCGLPNRGTDLTGCDRRVVTVGILAGNNVTGLQEWYLELINNGRDRISSSESGPAPNLLVGSNKTYGGPNGWSGFYTFDSACSGTIDADLASARTDARGTTYVGPGPPVHVSGRFAAPSR